MANCLMQMCKNLSLYCKGLKHQSPCRWSVRQRRQKARRGRRRFRRRRPGPELEPPQPPPTPGRLWPRRPTSRLLVTRWTAKTCPHPPTHEIKCLQLRFISSTSSDHLAMSILIDSLSQIIDKELFVSINSTDAIR